MTETKNMFELIARAMLIDFAEIMDRLEAQGQQTGDMWFRL